MAKKNEYIGAFGGIRAKDNSIKLYGTEEPIFAKGEPSDKPVMRLALKNAQILVVCPQPSEAMDFTI